MLARGASAARVRADLEARGIAPEIVRDELAALAHELGEEPERAAARALLRRRRLLPEVAGGWTEERRRRALAILARAGFPFEVASAVLGELEAASRRSEDGE